MLEFWMLYMLTTFVLLSLQALMISSVIKSNLERCKEYVEAKLNEFNVAISLEN